jgi:hypothetical protein
MDNYHTQQPAFQQEAWPKQQGADVTGEWRQAGYVSNGLACLILTTPGNHVI